MTPMSTAPRSQRLDLLASDLHAIGLGAGEGASLITPALLTRLLEYAEFLQRWNARIRLVGPSDLDTIVREQLVDACGFALAIAALDAPHLIDVGAGGGLPGIPLAVMFPDRDVLHVEPIHKKTAFLAQAAQALALTNTRVHTGRAEPDGRFLPPLRQPLSNPPYLALSRATLAPSAWLQTAKNLVGHGGLVVIAIAGEDTLPRDVTDDPESTEVGRWTYTVPATRAPRTLVARRTL